MTCGLDQIDTGYNKKNHSPVSPTGGDFAIHVSNIGDHKHTQR